MQILQKHLIEIKKRVRDGKSGRANNEMRIPERYRGKPAFKNKTFQQALDAVAMGNSLFLTGICGSGKTHLAVCLMNEWFALSMQINFKRIDDYDISSIGFTYPSKGTPLFLPAIELFLEIKQSWRDEEHRRAESEVMILDKYSRVPLLVIDDLGAERISEWSRNVIYLLIDRRYRDMKQTIITSNLTHDQLAEQFDDRIASRICEMGIVIDMGNKDWRLG